MTGRRRTILLAALALAIPLPALALTGGGESGLTVDASLGGCGVAGGGIVCEIETSFGSIDGARYYTASVTAPDGSVTDFGQIAGAGGGGTSLWVPYVGNGTYSVTVTAWGEDERGGEPEVIDEDKASTTGETEELRKRDVEQVGEGSYEVPEAEEEQAEPPPAEQPAEVPPAPPCEPAPAPAPAEPPAGELDGAPEDPGAAETEAAPSGEVAPEQAPVAPDCPPTEPAPAPAPVP